MDIRPLGVTQQNYQTDKPADVQGQPQAQPETKPATEDVVALGTNGVPESGTQKKWTFLLYGAGDNNLSTFIKGNMTDMEKVGADANTHMACQLDLSSGDCKRYYVTKEPAADIQSPMLENMGPSVDMSNPKTLTDFIVWGVKNFPGEHVALSIGDHGGGTAGAVTDDRDGSGIMTPGQIKQALNDAEAITGKKLDILGFDCCVMANTEVAYELRNTADFMVASEENEGGAGWPYTKIMTEEALKELQVALENRINVGPKEFATKIVNDASTVQGDLPTLSTIDLSKMDNVTAKMDAFSKAILDSKQPMADLKAIGSKTQSFSGFKDIFDFCDKLVKADNIKDEALKATAKDVLASLGEAILANQHSTKYPGAHGLQIELPSYGGPSGAYKELEFGQATKWGEALKKMTSKAEVME